MQINNIIHMIYDDKYPYQVPIIADCTIISDKISANGKVEIKRGLDTLHFIAESWKFDKIIEVSGKGNSHILEINSKTLPTEYKCEITNFPSENRIDSYKQKDIIIKLHRVTTNGDFTINMEGNNSSFECDLLPLYVHNSGEIGEMCMI